MKKEYECDEADLKRIKYITDNKLCEGLRKSMPITSTSIVDLAEQSKENIAEFEKNIDKKSNMYKVFKSINPWTILCILECLYPFLPLERIANDEPSQVKKIADMLFI